MFKAFNIVWKPVLITTYAIPLPLYRCCAVLPTAAA